MHFGSRWMWLVRAPPARQHRIRRTLSATGGIVSKADGVLIMAIVLVFTVALLEFRSSYAPVAIGLHPFLQQPEPVQNSLFGMISQE